MLVPFRTRSLITGVYPDLVGSSLTLFPTQGVDWPIEFHSACHGRLLTWYVYWHKLVWSWSSSLRQREGIEIAKCRVPIRSPIDASRQVCGETQKLLRGIIPLKQLQGSVMVDNWRQGWEKAAQEVLNAQRYGCWPVSAATKWASVSWKKVIYSFFLQLLVNITSLIGWLNSKPDGCFLLGPFLWINWERCAAKVENVCLAARKNTFFFIWASTLPLQWSNWNVQSWTHLSAAAWVRKLHVIGGKCTTAFAALAGPSPTSSSFFFDRLDSIFFALTLAGTPSAGHPRGSFLPVCLWCHSCVSEGGERRDDYCPLHSTYISICGRLFSNLLQTGRSAVRKCASQAAN